MRDSPDNALEDAFDDGNDSNDESEVDDRQRLMRGDPSTTPTTPIITAAESTSTSAQPSSTQRRGTILPTFTTPVNSRVVGTGSSNDGVFANLNAKPERAEKQEEDLPPVCCLLFCRV